MLDHDRQTKNLLVRGSGFSLEAPDGVRFLIRSRLFTDEELADLPDVRSGPIDGPR